MTSDEPLDFLPPVDDFAGFLEILESGEGLGKAADALGVTPEEFAGWWADDDKRQQIEEAPRTGYIRLLRQKPMMLSAAKYPADVAKAISMFCLRLPVWGETPAENLLAAILTHNTIEDAAWACAMSVTDVYEALADDPVMLDLTKAAGKL